MENVGISAEAAMELSCIGRFDLDPRCASFYLSRTEIALPVILIALLGVGVAIFFYLHSAKRKAKVQ